ncbi:MAG: endonuclease/exonuclease/phosphatase family protein [Prevotella sp.]|nr:endonuclease/exonuclease/phosphatase family protein [Prevotella sp.]
MGKLAVYKYFSFMILVITLLMALFTIAGLFGGNANPTHETAIAMIVYALPIFIIGDLIVLTFWLIRRRWHWAAIPAVVLISCIPYIGTIFQLGLFQSEPDNKSGFKVASYNVAMFGREITGFKAEDILSEMKRQNVDILCLQEYMEHSGDRINSEKYKAYFTYGMAKGHDDMVIFSRFPIKNSGDIDFGGPTNNSAMWADIDVGGKLVRVFNVHLETTGFNRTMRKVAKLQMKGAQIEDNAIIKAVYGDYTRGMVVRSMQADLVARHIRESAHPAVVCGDFNDVPYSYTYNVMKGDLVDGFKECGSGFMKTFRGSKLVRIDYILHDEALSGKGYYKLDISYSDHYPVFMTLSY